MYGYVDQQQMGAPPAAAVPVAEAPAAGNCRVFVGNLAWATTSEELAGLVAQAPGAGVPLSCEVARSNTGRSLGRAVVELATPEAAEAVIAGLNEYELTGRRLLVREDRGPSSKSNGGANNGVAAAPAEPGTGVFVGNMAWETTGDELAALVATVPGAGVIVSCELACSKAGRSLGRAVVELTTPDAAAAVIAGLNEYEFGGRKLMVREDRPAGGRGGAKAEKAPKPPPPAPTPNPRVFIGNMAWATTAEELAAVVGSVPGAGVLVSCDLALTNTGRSLGRAEVELSSTDAAAAVIAGLNEYELGGRRLLVRYARV
jgi:RNA recognition motif-containing protein